MKTSASHISKALKDAGLRRSTWQNGKVCGGMTQGFETISTGSGAVCVRYNKRTLGFGSDEQFKAERDAAIAKAIEVLTAKGYTVEVITEKQWDGNANATFGFFNIGNLRVTK